MRTHNFEMYEIPKWIDDTRRKSVLYFGLIYHLFSSQSSKLLKIILIIDLWINLHSHFRSTGFIEKQCLLNDSQQSRRAKFTRWCVTRAMYIATQYMHNWTAQQLNWAYSTALPRRQSSGIYCSKNINDHRLDLCGYHFDINTLYWHSICEIMKVNLVREFN